MQQHSVLHPAGPQAGRIVTLWHQLELTAVIVFVLVIGALLYAVARRRPASTSAQDDQRTAGPTIGLAVAATVFTLLLFVGASVWADRQVTSASPVPALHLHVIGHEWWWQVEYLDSIPPHSVITANELHVPTGRPITVELTSADVIHSFWVPNVDGKIDLVPGRTNWLTFQVDSVGSYRGNCAEFCGLEHAKMGLVLMAERPDHFAAWLQHQSAAAPPPADSEGAAGQRVFDGSGCALCHTVRGTPANGTVGPDLTHIGSRQMLAAGALANTPDHLADWIVHTSAIKPGTLMPPTRNDPAALHALVSWLESLQ